ncbi:dihydropteroate synthase [Haloarcula amylovorans]|uniref:dihydropteroate synthase n=1 Tax=Haloarcula amylovorans TaxID=2562280 RepID=UPI0010769BCA
MDILNVTPDSFHNRREYTDVDDAIQRARAMIATDADIIDVGRLWDSEGNRPQSANHVIASSDVGDRRIGTVEFAVPSGIISHRLLHNLSPLLSILFIAILERTR